MKNDLRKPRLDPLKIAIIGVVGLALFFVVMIIAFGENWESQVAELSDEETFFVYLYTEDCEFCQELAPEIQFFTQEQPMGIHLIPEDAATTSIRLPSDQSRVPRIFVVHQGEIVRIEAGLPDIRALLNEAHQGIFQP